MSFKQFLIRLIAFILGVILVDQVSGIFIQYLYDHAGDKFERETYMRRELNAPVLMFGSSRCTHHYMPSVFSDSLSMPAYNCGQRGNGIIYTYGRLSTIFERYTPKVVIIDFIQVFDIEKNDNNRYLDYLKIDYGGHRAIDSLFYDCDPSSKYKMLLKSYRYNSLICDLVLNTVLRNRGRFSKDGFMPLEGTYEIDGNYRLIKNTLKSIDPIKEKYIRKLAKEKRDGCNMFFVMSPTFNDPPSEEFIALISSIAKENNIPFLDYSYDKQFLGHAELFSDEAHMNTTGAELFSKKLAHAIKELIKEECVNNEYKE